MENTAANLIMFMHLVNNITIKEGIDGLSRNKVMQISMDGPSVDWSLIDKYENDLLPADRPIHEKLLYIGSCGLPGT